MGNSVDLGRLLDGYGDDPQQGQLCDAQLPGSAFDELVHSRTSDAAAEKARRRQSRGDPAHKIRVAPLDDPHGTMRRIYPDWL